MKKIFICLFFIVFASGCTFNIGQRLVYMHDKFPEYPVIEEPSLEDLSGNELQPYKALVEYTKTIYEDDEVTDEEAKKYNEMLEQAQENAALAREKIKGNIEALRKWGRKNEATLRNYNNFSEKMNKRTYDSP